MSPQDALIWFTGLSLRFKVLAFASLVVLVELGFRRFAPKSKAYLRWTAFFQGIGSVWTAVILSVVYALSVGPIGLLIRLFGGVRSARPRAKPNWRAQAESLGPERAARHQF